MRIPRVTNDQSKVRTLLHCIDGDGNGNGNGIYTPTQAAYELGRLLGRRVGVGQELVSCLHDRDPNVQITAIQVLGDIESKNASRELVEFATVPEIHGGNDELRCAAIEALSKIKDASTIDSLVRLLYDVSLEVPVEAARALGNFGSYNTYEILYQTAKGPLEQIILIGHGVVPETAVSAVFEVLREQAQEAVNKIVVNVAQYRLGNSKSTEEKCEILEELVKIKNKQACMVIIHYLYCKDDDGVLRKAEQVLIDNGDEGTINILQAIVDEYNYPNYPMNCIRDTALRAIEMIQKKEVPLAA